MILSNGENQVDTELIFLFHLKNAPINFESAEPVPPKSQNVPLIFTWFDKNAGFHSNVCSDLYFPDVPRDETFKQMFDL
jgi:hypothetical protein